MTIRTRALAAAAAVTMAAATLAAAPAHADDPVLPPPVLKRVKYTVSAKDTTWTKVYYLGREPAVWSDWSHNPYEFSPTVEADIGPGQPWSFELMMEKPERYAYVAVNAFSEPGTPNYSCTLEVDGKVVVTKDGPRGVLCSIRPW